MDICVIAGKKYNVLVVNIKETANILYSENTGRSASGDMVLDPIGTYIGHEITVARRNGFEKEYDDLYNFLLTPRYDGIPVRMVHDQKHIDYEAYVSTVSRPVTRIDEVNEKVYWGEMQINIVPMSAQVKPI